VNATASIQVTFDLDCVAAWKQVAHLDGRFTQHQAIDSHRATGGLALDSERSGLPGACRIDPIEHLQYLGRVHVRARLAVQHELAALSRLGFGRRRGARFQQGANSVEASVEHLLRPFGFPIELLDGAERKRSCFIQLIERLRRGSLDQAL